jgi:hypothetical protein
MGSLLERLILDDGEPRLRGGAETTCSEVSSQIEAGEIIDPAQIAVRDLLAVLAFAGLGTAKSLGPALVQQAPARPRLEQAASEPALARLLPRADRATRLALAAGLLQVLDFWDQSHHAAQAADDLGEARFSAYWHGIAHRREPDAGNAAYWFRRVGRHPLFKSLGEAAEPILRDEGGERFSAKLLGSGGWNPLAMIDLGTAATPGTAEEALARRLQRLEMALLLDATTEAACGD